VREQEQSANTKRQAIAREEPGVLELGGPAGEFPANIFETVKIISEKILRATTTKNKRTMD